MEELLKLLAPSLLQVPWVSQLLALPLVMKLFVFMGVARAVLKPLLSACRAYVQATPSKKDDEVLDRVEMSKTYKMIAYVFDYLFSLKLIK